MRYTAVLCLALFFGGCEAPVKNTKELCEQTVRDYAVFRDLGPTGEYGDLFAKDGVFILGDTVTKGREALMQRQQAANESAIWRHNMLDVRIDETSGHLVGKSRFIIYTAPYPAPAANPREIMGTYFDKFAIEDGKCLISSRRVSIVFDTQP